MPLYLYRCDVEACGAEVEESRKIDDRKNAPPRCEACGAEGTMWLAIGKPSWRFKEAQDGIDGWSTDKDTGLLVKRMSGGDKNHGGPA